MKKKVNILHQRKIYNALTAYCKFGRGYRNTISANIVIEKTLRTIWKHNDLFSYNYNDLGYAHLPIDRTCRLR